VDTPGMTGESATPMGMGMGSRVAVPMGMGKGSGEGTAGQATVLPDSCLVRVVDVQIEPGKTYQYRMRVRMANPNFGRRDVASPAYARDAELKSDLYEVPGTVRMDSELKYYAVDQKQFDLEESKKDKAGRFRYTGPYANDMVDGRMLNRSLQVMLQAHRWLRDYNLPGSSRPIQVGSWVVAERVPVYRGEYVAERERVQVPYWRSARNDWLILDDFKNKRWPGVFVNFGYQAGGKQPEAILVDFHNGATAYDRVLSRTEEKVDTRRVTDTSAGEVLMLAPDGKLLLHEGADDATSQERIDRLKTVKARLDEVKHPGKEVLGGKDGGFSDK